VKNEISTWGAVILLLSIFASPAFSHDHKEYGFDKDRPVAAMNGLANANSHASPGRRENRSLYDTIGSNAGDGNGGEIPEGDPGNSNAHNQADD